ncbi:MAG TPA: polyphosphate kinase 1 [Chthoniobacteraceae bacterium]|nr:polyphosphate kinase 1 [Chthoniobacteraceae bacterium]
MRLNEPQLYINRELSWLEFNQRVLDQALDESNPLLERLKFLCIVSSNLDEFFEIRVAGLKQQKQTGSSHSESDGLNATQQLAVVSRRVRQLVADQYRCWREKLLPELEARCMFFRTYSEAGARTQKYFTRHFQDEVFPVLTPLAIDPVHPFPQLLNKSLNVVVEIEGNGASTSLAIVQVPRILPRVVSPPHEEGGPQEFLFIGNIIQHHVSGLFHGMKVKGAHQFRITRNSELYIDEEEAENVLQSIEMELRHRNRGAAVRLEVQADCPAHITQRLLKVFKLEEEDCYQVDGPINFSRLFSVIEDLDRPELKFERFSTPVTAGASGDIFREIRDGDVLLHHPFDSFQPVVDFIAAAAADPSVLAIKQTLYRTSGDTPIVPRLIEAAEHGKQVTAVIELKARFDEAANIKWARMLQEAGADVVYGLVGMKTHCKLALVVRREKEGIRRYVHLGTGNYHPSTARFYTDMGLFTTRPEITDDCALLFNLLTGVSQFPGMKKLLVSPFTLHARLLELIDAEIANAQAGRPAGIYAKLNALVDPEIITALYRASSAGVDIRLLVRGICTLRPQVPGVSERIHVRSIVGRFLEHSRIYQFTNGGDRLVYLASADWMPRNFYRRVETCFPIEEEAFKKQIAEVLEIYWSDTSKARELGADGVYRSFAKPREPLVSAQDLLLASALQRAKKHPLEQVEPKDNPNP